jgi:hypothetical protein
MDICNPKPGAAASPAGALHAALTSIGRSARQIVASPHSYSRPKGITSRPPSLIEGGDLGSALGTVGLFFFLSDNSR